MLNNFETSLNNHYVIPMTWLHWAWQTWFDGDFFEVELEIGKTFQTLQEFDYKFTVFRFPVFQSGDIGKTKVFLVSSRYCEVNGNEFFPADMDSYNIVIGEIVEINTFENINPYPPKTWETEKWLQYTPTTPAYKILVKNIFPLKDFLQNPFSSNLSILAKLVTQSETDFLLYQLNYGRGNSGIHDKTPYQLAPNIIAHDLIHIFVSTGEYSTADYIITKIKTAHSANFYIRYFEQYLLDDKFYLLANYHLSQKEIQLLTLDNAVCKKFFET